MLRKWCDDVWGDKVDLDEIRHVVHELRGGTYGKAFEGGSVVRMAIEGGYKFD